MYENEEKEVSLVDLVDVEFLQELQDAFAKASNVASIMVDHQGPITKPSNFTEFCIKYTRGSSLGYKRCNECDITLGKQAALRKEPVIYNCHSGLTDFAVPIVVNGKHIASILGGQVLTTEPDEEHFRRIAKELSINEDEYIEALRKIKIVPMENVIASANLLYFVANTISEVSLKNLKLLENNMRQGLYKRITEKIRSSLDIDETLTFICEEVAKLFNVQRATITQFPDSEDYGKYTIRSEYRSNNDIKGLMTDKYLAIKVASYWGHSLLFEDRVLSFDNIQESDTPDFFREYYTSLGIKSMIGFPIKMGNKKWGSLVLSEYKKYRSWSEEERNLLETISDQIYIAINQAELYNALKLNTAKQNAILNNMPFMAWLKDASGKLVAVNDAFAKMCKTSIDNVIGKTDFDFFPKEHAASYQKEDKNVMESRQTISIEELIVGEDGAKWNETFKSPVIDDNGQVIGTVGIARDITEKKEADLELFNKQQQIIKAAEGERLIGSIIAKSISTFDVTEVIKSITTETGKVFKANRCFFAEYDSETNSYVHIKSAAEYLSSDAISSHDSVPYSKNETDIFIELLKKKEVRSVDDLRILNLPETTKAMLNKLSVKSYLIAPIYYGETLYGAIILHYTDDYKKFSQDDIDLIKAVATQSAIIIHQTQLYSEIETNEKYTRTLLNSIKDGIIAVNEHFIIESCNPAVENIWGYPVAELVGKKLDSILVFEITNKKNRYSDLAKITKGLRSDGTNFPVEIDVSEIVFDSKKVKLLVIRDITERVKMEKMKSEFVSTVSHELRTPLTSIKGSLGLIKSGMLGALPDKVSELVNIANNNCNRLANLINDILDLEKIKAGKMEFDYQEIEINEFIDQAIVLNEPYAQEFGMKLKFVKQIETAYVKADRSRLLQVITNLISNAVKFSRPGEEVTITSELKKNIVKVSFKDRGIGIPENAKHKIFTSFSQVDSSDTRSKGGTGLGLSICKLIMEKMGGEINFISTEGKGSTFYVKLALVEKGSFVKPDKEALLDLSDEDGQW